MKGTDCGVFLFRLLLAITLIAVIPGVTFAQSSSDDFSITTFRGGEVEANLRMGLNLAGVGIGSGTFGGVLSGRVSDGASGLFSNPANLGKVTAPQWAFDTRLGLGTSNFGVDGTSLIPPSDVRSETDEVLEELSFPENRSPTYPTVKDIDLGLQSQLSSFAVTLPLQDRFSVGLGLRRTVDFDLRTRASGIEAQLEADQESGGQTISIDFLTQMYGSLDAKVDITSLSFGTGGYVFNNEYGRLSLGLALNRHYATHELKIDVQPQAMIILNGSEEFFFNQSGDPNLAEDETNRFFWKANANYEDKAWGYRSGIHYQLPFEWLTLSALYTAAPDFKMRDPDASSRRFLPRFVDLTPPEGEDRVSIDDLSLAKPNLTSPAQDSLGRSLSLSLPSSLTIGMDLGLGEHTVTLNYVQYFGEISYEGIYSDNENKTDSFVIGKDLKYGVKYGMNFTFPDQLKGADWALIPIRLLYLDIDGLLFQAFRGKTKYRNPQYRIGGGVMFGDELTDKDRGSGLRDILDAPLPRGFALGRQYTIYNEIDVGVMLLGFPDTALRFGFSYTFQ